jgi:hypothetical protein
MKIDISKFGTSLTVRSEGHEAYLAARANVIPSGFKATTEKLELDFNGVEVLTPSWADEFITGLKREYGEDRLIILPGGSKSVEMSLEILAKYP